MRHGSVFGLVCLRVCLSVFCKSWPRRFVFGVQVRLQISRSGSYIKGQGHRSLKSMSVSYLQVVYLQLKGGVVMNSIWLSAAAAVQCYVSGCCPESWSIWSTAGVWRIRVWCKVLGLRWDGLIAPVFQNNNPMRKVHCATTVNFWPVWNLLETSNYRCHAIEMNASTIIG